jgi:N-acetylmuramoyl-L-alanine amidase
LTVLRVSSAFRVPLLCLCLALSVLSGCAESPSAGGAPLQSPVRAGRAPVGDAVQTIVLDAGHGGHDPGTSHFGMKEKYLALDITKRLRDELQQAGFQVVLTRDTDRFIPLNRRPAIANNMGADLFISVHINANRSRSISGIEVYYPRVSVVSSSGRLPPSVTEAELGSRSPTVVQVLWDLVLGRTRSSSRRLATSICRHMKSGLKVHCRGVKPARFVVLREAWMPAVLVEVGYITNQTEARRLGSASYRAAAAQAIAQGILSYVRDTGAQHI